MSRNFADRLIKKIGETGNPSIGGLDPKLDYIPKALLDEAYETYEGDCFTAAAAALLNFNIKLIDAVYDIIPAVKVQMAYYEMYGVQGMEAFRKTCEYAKSKGLIVVADGKRNDIGSTSQAYSDAYLGRTDFSAFGKGVESHEAYDIDCLTVNPYLGIDGIMPFLDNCGSEGKGIFALVKTSNPSSGQLQDQELHDGKKVFESVADLVNEWGESLTGESGYSSVGAVVGATWPEQAKILRQQMPKAIFLVPGYGAQGGSGETVSVNCDKNGKGAIVNASRSFMCAYKNDRWKDVFKPEEFDLAARAEMLRMRDEIISFL